MNLSFEKKFLFNHQLSRMKIANLPSQVPCKITFSETKSRKICFNERKRPARWGKQNYLFTTIVNVEKILQQHSVTSLEIKIMKYCVSKKD